MRPIVLVIASLSLASVASAQPSYNTQSPEDAVRSVVMELFDAMRAGDSTRVRNVFHEEASLHSSSIRSGGPIVNTGSIEGFVTAVGTPHDEVWDERIGDIAIQIDSGLASAWMGYTFYIGETRSHCGVNAIQLVNTEGGWKMLNIVDTRRQDCD